MAQLKKIINKNVCDAPEAEDLLPKPLPVVENRKIYTFFCVNTNQVYGIITSRKV